MSEKQASAFDDIRTEWKNRLGATIVKALEGRGYGAAYVSTKEEALKAVLKLIPEGASVGVPGTVTIREIGAFEALEKKGHTVHHHWDPSLTAEGKKQKLKDELSSDVFLTSTNAVTIDGKMVNIDGTGNRLAGMCWTGGKIIYVVGINKVCKDVESAMQRVRDVATPMNAIRLGLDVPCAKLGYHIGCPVPKTVCRALLIMENPTMGRESHVILVGEDLGY